jgi:hypothetical protein
MSKLTRQHGMGMAVDNSTTGALEGALFMKEHKLVNLSQQNLLDCSYVAGTFDVLFTGLQPAAYVPFVV